MKYQVLARKYRPKTFSTMVGQEHVLKALANALDSDRLHHAYLFTGTRGVGKTTVARVLAKALNCEQGVTATPCGKCTACEEIDQGRFIDLIEVDAASRTKVEDTRDLLDNVQYAPSRGRFKIYLIDEVHMLSGHSFNALLKTLEEPPPHVKFLLATTDPQKLPVTILSRCLQFNLKSLTIEQIETQLRLVLNTENIAFNDNILKPLAIAADGSMRDGLSLLDQAIAYCDAKPNLSDIETMLGSVQKDRIFELLTALVNEDGRMLIEQSRVLFAQGIDVKTVLAELITLLQRIALCQQVPDAIDDSLGDKNALEKIAEIISAEDIQLYYQIALNGRKDLPYSPQPQGGFEMILLRMLAFKPVGAVSQQKVKLSTAQKKPLSAVPSKQTSAINSQTQKPDQSQSNNSTLLDYELPPVEAYSQENLYESSDMVLEQKPGQEQSSYNTNTAQTQTDNLKKNASIDESSAKNFPLDSTSSNEQPISQSATPVLEKLSCETKSDELAAYWYDLIERSQVTGLVQQLAKHCALASQSEHSNGYMFELLLESVHKHLLNDKMKARLQKAIQQTLGSDIKLDIKECQLIAEEQLQTPRRREIQEAEILQQEAVKSIFADPKVDLLLSSFSAIVREDTIKPLDTQHTIH